MADSRDAAGWYGARAVLIGRPVVWGLAVDGERGVSRVLEILHGELELAMALCGAPSFADISADLVAAGWAGNGPFHLSVVRLESR